MSDDIIVCRCEDIKLSEIQEHIAQGAHTTEEIKRRCRCGMGSCQGRTCMPIVAQELAKATGKPVGEISLPTFRQPTAAIKLGALTGGDGDD
ncbi:MAG: (2Fe-2S)-binding protein [Veillonellaceae bacterium]|jgi:NAD(P)H-nitrite reductase large subunit|nr:(2Fe-2S)-binding protein [Veillonellaceae bacterium]